MPFNPSAGQVEWWTDGIQVLTATPGIIYLEDYIDAYLTSHFNPPGSSKLNIQEQGKAEILMVGPLRRGRQKQLMSGQKRRLRFPVVKHYQVLGGH